MVKMKLKTNTTSLLVLYVCYWPGLEDRSSGPGVVSRAKKKPCLDDRDANSPLNLYRDTMPGPEERSSRPGQ